MKRSLAAAAVVLLLAGCSSAAPASTEVPSSSAPSPSVTASEDTTDATADSPILGSWTNSISRELAKRTLRDADLANWQDPFFDHEADVFSPAASWIYTFTPTTFSGAWKTPDGSWQIGYKGALALDGDLLVLSDADGGFDSTFRWTVDGDELVLEFVDNDGTGLYNGVPPKTFDIVYMTPKPFQRTDCTPDNNFCA